MNITSTSFFNQSDTALSTGQKKQYLSQDDFLRLMTAQLKAQDPLKPLDNAQFVSQMAQFSTVSGIQGLQASFEDLAKKLSSDNLLQGASLIGKDALVPSQILDLNNENCFFSAELDDVDGKVVVAITDSFGQKVDEFTYQSANSKIEGYWDGKNSFGDTMPPGEYKINIYAIDANGSVYEPKIMTHHRVNNISVGQTGSLEVHVGTGGVYQLSEIKGFSG